MNPVAFLRRLVADSRRKKGRKPQPTVAVIDSQSVRSGYAQSQKGVDGYKKVKGIKRQILVDTNLGLRTIGGCVGIMSDI